MGAILASATSASAGQGTITGTVLYRERLALPPDSRLEVTLVDVTLAGSPPQTVARVVQAAVAPPMPFSLPFDPGRIESGHRYALQARIGSASAVWFTTPEAYTVDPLSSRYAVEIVVQMVGRPPPTEPYAADPSPAQSDEAGTGEEPGTGTNDLQDENDMQGDVGD
jgi:uncharacterized lipoprotein YbaY